jgi:RNA polymerase sigma-70 factor (ECF subfamily)
MSAQDCDGQLPSAPNIERAKVLFEEYGQFILQVIRSKVKEAELVDDLFQDFFMELICKPIPDYVENIKSYLYKAVSNSIIDFFRKNKKHRACVSSSDMGDIQITNELPDRRYVAIEESKKMLQIIERNLPDREANAIKMRYQDNCEVEEVANEMGVDRRSVSQYVSSGLRTVRQYLIKRGDYYDQT